MAHFAPKQCWALRKESRHKPGDDRLCQHYEHQEGWELVCIPMVAQGETLGILRILPPEEDWDPTMMNLSPVTISMGVSLYPDHGTEDSKLLSIADEALYQTKSSGRNRDVLANTETGIHAVENRAKPNP